MEIGACSFCAVAEGLEAKMAVLHGLGYDFVEPAWLDEEAAGLGRPMGEALKRMADRTGCPVRSAILGTITDLGKRLEASGPAADLDLVSRACDTLAAAGGDVLLIPNWAGQSAPGYDGLYTAFLLAAADRALRSGVRLGIEHIPGSKYRNTAAQVADLVAHVDSPAVGVYYDIANNLYIDDDPVKAARAAAPWLVQMHLKDYPPGGKRLADMPLLEVKAIVEAAGFQGRVCVEIDPPEGASDPNAHLADALATLRSLGF